jgi:hypothetical protein
MSTEIVVVAQNFHWICKPLAGLPAGYVQGREAAAGGFVEDDGEPANPLLIPAAQ